MAEPAFQLSPPNPSKSPSYPQRVHTRERPEWQARLQSCEERIAQAAGELAVMPEGSVRQARHFLYCQMLGARDQIADSVRRLPMEVDGMYDEDKHLLDEAEAALNRIFDHWTPNEG